MTVIKKLSLVGSSVALCTSLFAVEVKENDKTETLKKETSTTMDNKKIFTEAELLKTYGWVTFMQSGVKSLGLDQKEVDFFIQGAQMAAKGEDSPCVLGEVMEDLQKFLQNKATKYAEIHQKEVQVIAEKNKKLGKEFIDGLLKENKNAKLTDSGLCYEIKEAGDLNNKAGENDTVEIHYIGKLIDGKVFDKSNDKTVKFPLNGVIPGIKEGAQLIGKGGKITLYIPANLAYGENELPSIPAGSTLVFDLDIIDIIKTNEGLDKVEAVKENVQPAKEKADVKENAQPATRTPAKAS